jgi:hypothetical protein
LEEENDRLRRELEESIRQKKNLQKENVSNLQTLMNELNRLEEIEEENQQLKEILQKVSRID